jgi:hypothetical protein
MAITPVITITGVIPLWREEVIGQRIKTVFVKKCTYS